MDTQATSDRCGKPVHVGTRVRVVAIADQLQRTLPADEWQRIQEMLGETLTVYEIDEWGAAWVEKVWSAPGGEHLSHSISLDPPEMEVVE